MEAEQLERALELSPDVVTLVCGANDVLCQHAPGRRRVRRAAGADVHAPARGAPRGDDPHRDLPGHLPVPRPAAAVADPRGAGDAEVQRRLPRGGPASRGRAARGLRPPGHEPSARASPRTASTSARRATAPPPASSCARSQSGSPARPPGVSTEAPAQPVGRRHRRFAPPPFEQLATRRPLRDRRRARSREADILEFAGAHRRLAPAAHRPRVGRRQPVRRADRPRPARALLRRRAAAARPGAGGGAAPRGRRGLQATGEDRRHVARRGEDHGTEGARRRRPGSSRRPCAS